MFQVLKPKFFGNKRDYFGYHLLQYTNLTFSDLEKFWVWKLTVMGLWESKYLIKIPESFWKGVGNNVVQEQCNWNASSEEGVMEGEEDSGGMEGCLPSFNLGKQKISLSLLVLSTLPDITPTVNLCLYFQLKNLLWNPSARHRYSSLKFLNILFKNKWIST